MVIGLSATQWYLYLKGSIPFPSVMSHFSFHLYELIWRIIWYPLLFSSISLIILGTNFKVVLFYLLSNANIPFLLLTNPLDGIWSYLSLIVVTTMGLIFFPLLIVQFYFYIRPALVFLNSSYTWEIILLSLLLFFPLFSWKISWIILPKVIEILISPIFGNKDLNLFIYWTPQLNSIISLYYYITIFTWIVLLTPIIIITVQIKRGNPIGKPIFNSIGDFRPWVLFFILFVLAIITPPDLLTLLIISIPLIIIFEISIFCTRLVLSYSLGKTSIIIN